MRWEAEIALTCVPGAASDPKRNLGPLIAGRRVQPQAGDSYLQRFGLFFFCFTVDAPLDRRNAGE
jgi:hypothetical protein